MILSFIQLKKNESLRTNIVSQKNRKKLCSLRHKKKYHTHIYLKLPILYDWAVTTDSDSSCCESDRLYFTGRTLLSLKVKNISMKLD